MCDSMKSLFSIEQFGAQAATEISAAMELLHEEKMKNIAMLRDLYAIQRPELDMKIHELYLQERSFQVACSSVNGQQRTAGVKRCVKNATDQN